MYSSFIACLIFICKNFMLTLQMVLLINPIIDCWYKISTLRKCGRLQRQRRKRLPTPGFWPGEFHELYSPWGHKESDTTEWLSLSLLVCRSIVHEYELHPRWGGRSWAIQAVGYSEKQGINNCLALWPPKGWGWKSTSIMTSYGGSFWAHEQQHSPWEFLRNN